MRASFYGSVRKISLELRLKRIIISFKHQDTTFKQQDLSASQISSNSTIELG